MTAALAPYADGNDFYVPYFEVRVGDRPLPKDAVHDVMQVTYKDSLTELDQAQLTITNWDAERRAYKYSDQNLFVPGKQFELWLGYYGETRQRRVLKGEITSMKPTFPAGGAPALTVEALNVLHRFRRKQNSQAYENLTDSEIASRIITRLGARPIVDQGGDAPRYQHVMQDNQPDILFLLERARRVGYDLFVVEPEDGSSQPGIYFGPSSKVKRATTKLEYGKSLVEFSSNLSAALQVSKVTVLGWDNAAKREIRYTAQRSEIQTQGVGEAGDQAAIDAAFRDREEVIADKPVGSLAEAKTVARETLEAIAKEMLVGTGSTVGDPDLRAGGVVLLGGLGKRFDGRYFLTSTTHTLGDNGYTTQFECRREELKRGG